MDAPINRRADGLYLVVPPVDTWEWRISWLEECGE
jgi:hypothetical protein